MAQRLSIDDPNLKTVSMSNRQFAALKMFTSHPKDVVELERALEVNQSSFGSLHHREYIVYDQQRGGFIVTPKGRQAMRIYEDTDVLNKERAQRFSHFIRDSVKYLNTKFTFEATA